MAEALTVARGLAGRAGRLVIENLDARKSVGHKGAVDLVTSIDRRAEEIIVAGLADAFPEHSVVAEESSAEPPSRSHAWYVDPIDGTCNFVHGIPHCSVSIALLVDGVPEVAVVADPFKEETFEATRGGGAHLNGRPITVSDTADLDRSLIVTGFPYDRRDRSAFYLAYFEAFMRRCQDLRRFGSASLDLCWVACGRFDGFFEWGLKPWDTAAGWLVVSEAGGRVSDFDGRTYDPWVGRIAATNGRIHDETCTLLCEARRA